MGKTYTLKCLFWQPTYTGCTGDSAQETMTQPDVERYYYRTGPRDALSSVGYVMAMSNVDTTPKSFVATLLTATRIE